MTHSGGKFTASSRKSSGKIDVVSHSQATVEGEAPAPRAHHTATKCGNVVYIFGGYAGGGRALDDLWALHLGSAGEAMRWELVVVGGGVPGPAPRFDHCAFAFPVQPNSSTADKLVILGGRDNGQVRLGWPEPALRVAGH